MRTTYVWCTVLVLLIATGLVAQETARPILVLYAFHQEGVVLTEQMTATKTDTVLGRPVVEGTLAGQSIVLAETGVGMVNAAMTTEALVERFHPRAVVLSGIAGAIDTSVHVGDICVPERWAQHDYGYYGKNGYEAMPVEAYSPAADSVVEYKDFAVDTLLLGVAEDLNQDSLKLELVGQRRPKVILGGMGVSGNQFIDSIEKREWLASTFHAFVTDMESASVAQVCAVNSLPFLIFRSASDLAGGSGSSTAQTELEQFFKIAAKNSAVVVVGVLRGLGGRESKEGIGKNWDRGSGIGDR